MRRKRQRCREERQGGEMDEEKERKKGRGETVRGIG